MSYEGQSHHPHTRGEPPNGHLIGVAPRNEPYIPNGLRLVQAHWFVRHGERSPVRQRLTGYADIPALFPLCSIGRSFSTAVLSFTSTPFPSSTLAANPGPDGEIHSFEGASDSGSSFQSAETSDEPTRSEEGWNGAGGRSLNKKLLSVRRLTEEMGPKNQANRGQLSDCYWGELTDLGRESTLTLGARLRHLYVDQLKFLPSTLPDLPVERSSFFFRSTGMPRTIESLHQIVEGLFPQGSRQGHVDYTVRNANDESLYPNSLCARMRQLDQISSAQAALENNPSLAELDDKIMKYTKVPLRIDSSPRANGILDTIYVCRAHDIKTPSEFEDPAVLRTLEKAVVHEWFDAYRSIEFTKLSMGRLLGDLKSTLQRKIFDPTERSEKLRLAVYACHDTSLGGMLNSLEAFNGHWPPFTSHISIELLKSDQTESRSKPSLSSYLPSFLRANTTPSLEENHYVRLRFNSKNIVLPACAAEGDHLEGSKGEICTFAAFRKAVERVELTGKEWEEGCKVKDKVSTATKIG